MPGYGFTTEDVDAGALITEAVEGGVGYVDTAVDYGSSEQLIGVQADRLSRAGVRICTKVRAEELPGNRVAESRLRLRVDRIDTLLVHSATIADIESPGCGRSFERLKREGHISRAGASTYGTEAAARALASRWCDTVQVEHSLLNPSVVSAVRTCRRPGQEVVVRSVLCRGLLTARRAAASHLSDESRRLLDEADALAAEWGLPLAQLAVRFALDTPGVDIVLVGAGTTEELRCALEASRRSPLTPEQLDILGRFDRSTESWTHPEQWPTHAA